MDFIEFQEEARRTQRKDLPLWATREHALFCLGSEVGEVLGLHQKVHQGHPLDETELRLEIGDVLWACAELCDCYGWSLEDDSCINGVMADTLALLKAQEPVEPKKNDVELAGLRTWDWACPECNCILTYRANYCSCCGRAVKWDG